MDTTWGAVRDRVRRFITDELADRTPRVSEQELVDAWIDAQDDLILYAARPATFTVPAGVNEAFLPNDLYRIDFCKIDYGDDENHYRVRKLDAMEEDDYNVWEGNYWYMTHDKIVFTGDALEYAVTVFYRAYYPEPSTDDENMPILVPRWALQACVYYVAGVCIEKQVAADPQLRQYASRRQDSGNPTHNPFLQVAEYMFGRYRQKVYDRTQDVENERLTWHSSYR